MPSRGAQYSQKLFGSARRPGAVGQVLVIGLVFLFLGAVGSCILFNFGQMMSTKNRLTNAVDAAAYSTAAWRARVLNFHAYSNRAILAQEVAVAQAVTLDSWAKYFSRLMLNVSKVTMLIPGMQSISLQAEEFIKYGKQLTEFTAGTEVFSRGDRYFGYKKLLQNSQEILNRSADGFGLGAIANEVVKANDPDFFAFVVNDGGFRNFTRRYESHADRQRLRQLVERSLPRFIGLPRRDDMRLPLPSACVGISGNPEQWTHWWRRRGGMQLTPDLEQWKAVDTASIHGFLWGLPSCFDRELLPIGWGASEAAPAENLLNGGWGGESGRVNPIATRLGEGNLTFQPRSFHTYGGIERVRELNYEGLRDKKFPTSKILVLGSQRGHLKTTDQLKGTQGGSTVEFLSKGAVWAVAAGEVYFQRPGSYSVSEPKERTRKEFASLYNPYWQARLSEVTTAQRMALKAYVH